MKPIDLNNTMHYPIAEHTNNIREILKNVYVALREKGYNPTSQLVGYLMSGDPTYITSYNNARSLICRLDRDELLQELLKTYLDK